MAQSRECFVVHQKQETQCGGDKLVIEAIKEIIKQHSTISIPSLARGKHTTSPWFATWSELME